MFDYRPVERPYPGLRPFEPWEAEIFFGREAHIDRLLEILEAQHFLTVTGPSGCGKSSLVRAGLLPVLPLGAIGTGSEWKVAIMRPGDQPLQSLAHSLCSEAAFGTEVRTVFNSTGQAETSYAMATVETELRRGPLGLVHLVENLRQHAEDPEFNLLVLVDQFEEIFTYADAGTRQADESEAFIDLLLNARDNRESRIFVVITMRTDFLGNCTRFLELPEAINRSQYLTPRLKRTQLAEAIAGPVRVFGGDLQAELVMEFVNAAGNEPDQLPVLQHALARMWDRACEGGVDKPKLTLDDFALVGGLGEGLVRARRRGLEDFIHDNTTVPRRTVAVSGHYRSAQRRNRRANGQAAAVPGTDCGVVRPSLAAVFACAGGLCRPQGQFYHLRRPARGA